MEYTSESGSELKMAPQCGVESKEHQGQLQETEAETVPFQHCYSFLFPCNHVDFNGLFSMLSWQMCLMVKGKFISTQLVSPYVKQTETENLAYKLLLQNTKNPG